MADQAALTTTGARTTGSIDAGHTQAGGLTDNVPRQADWSTVPCSCC
jgi:hypothetical protein